ncbi:carbohydrate ABC transporter permease [Paenibacillus filicis]|uniref:Carbohydrate ABC transporter permease n=1 Tax=Paenibacillus gyeongsangnamensis TaxID=3388067 RepID=A0ABT4Q5J2_9BACL|nr:carbohydrate ABC transporter permease [Paenibacillus filicis]MCZ8512157.1 carbohydrate ABC transporter permease [Paenibacillus filicis]
MVTVIKKTAGDKISDLFIIVSMWFVIIITVYPFLFVFSMSISDPKYVLDQSVWLFPKGFSVESYKRVFENPDIWSAYYNTIFYTVIGTILNVALTIFGAYPLSRRSFFARKQLMIFIVFTMFFSGGLIPLFILIKDLGLYNTRWAMIIPGAVSAFLLIVARTFFQSIPESLDESAKMDGANDITIMFRIIMPLSKPIIAVLALFYAVGHWNSYFSAMIYLPDAKLQPLQLYLVKILIQNQDKLSEGLTDEFNRALFTLQLKYSIIIVAILPILLIYPFLQKYFAKGVMVGSLKE